MTYRELFTQIMHYGNYDRMPVLHWTGWAETLERWYAEGMPRDVNEQQFFHANPLWGGICPNLALYPAFEEEVLEETETYRIFRGGDGVVCQDWKHKSLHPALHRFHLKRSERLG